MTDKFEIFPNVDGYRSLYGNLPNTKEELLQHLKSVLSLNVYPTHIKPIKWKELDITLFMVPHGSPRPRYGGNHFYVKGAKKMRLLIEDKLSDHNVVSSLCCVHISAYMPTPITSMTDEQIYLAELGEIRPMMNPDFDNIAKTYTDPLQPIILKNDNLIVDGRVEKYFSIKPRINILIKYHSSR